MPLSSISLHGKKIDSQGAAMCTKSKEVDFKGQSLSRYR
jgi:hypothetical protein